MKKNILLSIIFLGSILLVKAQDKDTFKPSGKIIARAFFDYSTGIDNEDNEQGFDITRAFLGYDYKITPSLSARVVLDGASGRSSSGKLEPYLRNAYLNWKDYGVNINIGLTGLLQFSTQENYWKHRYVLKSFQDLNKMAPSVDLGFTTKYTFNRYFSADFSLTNGEGYKNISQDNSMRYAVGLDFYPVKNILVRLYGDIYNESEDLRDSTPEDAANIGYKSQYSIAALLGYQNESISVGAEYNHLFNKGFIENKNYFGYSFYTSIKFHSKWRAFARYDLMDSKTPSGFTSPWNDLDGQLMIAGVEFAPLKQLKIAPNLRNINPDRDKSERYVFVNVEFNL